MLNRRHIFGASAAALIASVPAVSVAAPAADADLIALGARYEATWAEYHRAMERSKAAYKAFEQACPLPPETMRLTRADALDFGLDWRAVGEMMCPIEHRKISSRLADPRVTSLQSAGATARLRKRGQELIAAYDAHAALVERIEKQSGYVEADLAEDVLWQRVKDLQQDIVDAPCSTMAGLRVKALVCTHVLKPTTDVDNDWPETVGLSVANAILNGGLN